MKRIFAMALALVMIFGLCTCGAEPADGELTTVKLPISFFGETPPEEIIAGAEKNGYESCLVTEDGFVLYTMTKGRHEEECSRLKKELQSSVDSLLRGSDKVESFRDIVCAEDFSTFEIRVDGKKFTIVDSLYGMGFMATGAYYQMYAGKDAEKVDVVVTFVDDATDEILDTASYREIMSAE